MPVIFDGIRTRNKVTYLIFKSDRDGPGNFVEIPVEDMVAGHIMSYLSRLIPTSYSPVERGNEEDQE